MQKGKYHILPRSNYFYDFKNISEFAESYLGEPIKDAVITVPHSF